MKTNTKTCAIVCRMSLAIFSFTQILFPFLCILWYGIPRIDMHHLSTIQIIVRFSPPLSPFTYIFYNCIGLIFRQLPGRPRIQILQQIGQALQLSINSVLTIFEQPDQFRGRIEMAIHHQIDLQHSSTKKKLICNLGWDQTFLSWSSPSYTRRNWNRCQICNYFHVLGKRSTGLLYISCEPCCKNEMLTMLQERD